MSLEQNDPAYGQEKAPSARERRERDALREAIAEQLGRNEGVQPQIEAIVSILNAMKPEIEKMRLLRGHFPMKVDGNIISIDESVIGGAGADGIAEQFDCWRNGALIIKRLLVV